MAYSLPWLNVGVIQPNSPDNPRQMSKHKGFWTKPRKDIPSRLHGILAVFVLMILITGGWYTIALFAAIALGGVFAFLLYRSRRGEL